jgi:hypothetical protein
MLGATPSGGCSEAGRFAGERKRYSTLSGGGLGGDPSAAGGASCSASREIIGCRIRSGPRPETSLILPLRLDREKVHLGNFSYTAVARLKPGARLDQATADVARLIPVGLSRFPPFPGFSLKLFDEAKLQPNLRLLKADVIGDVGSVLWVLMGTIAMVLLIACANVANLLLVRAEGRQQELAVRAALGASGGRIAYELLAESVILGLVGGVAGLASHAAVAS